MGALVKKVREARRDLWFMKARPSVRADAKTMGLSLKAEQLFNASASCRPRLRRDHRNSTPDKGRRVAYEL